ncbi:hypothetical protein G5I_08002 [Acromyrmex echinatior]|uniref:Uncharacterized protein n=1 Tax=Acromyrmex echinatior TaxID=103372 RepID=F4WQC7_ACREC|nr:hypothetical protein G5I_08002 [Acromyrmex echinatior]
MVRFQDRPKSQFTGGLIEGFTVLHLYTYPFLPPILADRRLATVQRSYVTIPRRVHGDTSYTIRPEHQLPSRKSSAHHQGSTGPLISLATLFNVVHERRKEFTIKLRHPGFRAGIEPRMSRNHPNGQCKQGKFKRTKPREIIRRTKVQGSKRRGDKPQLVKNYEDLRKPPTKTAYENHHDVNANRQEYVIARETFTNPSMTFVRKEFKGLNKIASVTRSPMTTVHEKKKERKRKKKRIGSAQEEWMKSALCLQNRPAASSICTQKPTATYLRPIFIIGLIKTDGHALRSLFAFLVLIGNIAAKGSAINGTGSRHEPTSIERISLTETKLVDEA